MIAFDTDVATSVQAVLFDRDGTLIFNIPGLRDPENVRLREGVPDALMTARSAGLKLGVVTNQAGIGRGTVSWSELQAVNGEIERLCGAFDTWEICPHTEEQGCSCRKPMPGLVLRAARVLGVPVQACIVIGDRLSDLQAAQAAGGRGLLVPSEDTPQAELKTAGTRVASIVSAIDQLTLTGRIL